MKSLPLKKIAVAFLVLGVITFGIYYYITSNTSSKPVVGNVNPAFGEYISSYTAGVISSGSTIRIVFTRDAVDSTQFGNESSVRLFTLSPSVKGKTFWLNASTIEFRPDKPLQSGQRYQLEFALSRVLEVPKDLGNFEYSFQIIPQNFEISIDNVRPYEKTNLNRQKVEGTLYTADVAESASVETMLVSRQEGNNLKISWVHTDGGKQHLFTIEDVKRGDVASKVQLTA